MTSDSLDVWLDKNARILDQKNSDLKHPSAAPNPITAIPKTLRIIPLGGLDEIGKNMMVIEYGHDIVIIDMGFQFPEEEMLGIDYVIPDISYLKGKEHLIKGICITHGHLDHIGGIAYLIEKLGSPPIFATRLTIELIKRRNAEFKLKKHPQIIQIDSSKRVKLGVFTAEFFKVNHSIPDCVGVCLHTPCGTIVHTGDFKFDFTPADNTQADLPIMAKLGEKNVLALFSESTNALLPGRSISEATIGENLDKLIKDAPKRVIIAAFASLIGRIQQIINSAHKYHRRIYVSGASMEANITIAKKLGYLKLPIGTDIYRVKNNGRHVQDDALILSTGSQGEDISSLSRMAHGEHAHVKVRPGDTVILSSSPIVGNERAIAKVMNELCKRGARVISNQSVDVHISGHAKQEDLKMMISLIRPRYLVPIHGEYYMRTAHKELAIGMGMKDEHVLMLSNGSIFESDGKTAHVSKNKIETNYVLVEGPGIHNVGTQILKDRQILAENGIIVIVLKIRNKALIGFPEVSSRGFVFMQESKEILENIAGKAKDAYTAILERDHQATYSDVKHFISKRLETYVNNLTAKTPLILPVIVRV